MLVYEQAIAAVEGAAAGPARLTVATTWAGLLASAADTDSLRVLLGNDSTADADVTARCRTERSRRLLATNGLTQLNQLMELKIRDLQRIPSCGRATLIDILVAMLLTLVADPIVQPPGDVPLPGLGFELELRGIQEAAIPKAASYEPVSDPLLDILKSR
ncbi:hypothetical protein F4553_005287 [Allocatelliglobosispora scoriae]|uniref:Uncharacterized protein n=1 Tax=Allocatelliglobosispora scoriae TaxID=643052 RepID=A0A841BWP6_9ACTN|nr:hypothetical protein [Allocatelliglobosispora scoriae]MBB5871908.1 hypothetical protein [Allocatelliglobosispora scoriae]